MTWYRSISGVERRTFWACFGGWSLDALDLQMFSLVIPAIIATWHLSKTEAGLIGSVTLVAASPGGWLGGPLADRIGPLKALQLTILCFALASFVFAFTQSFEQLLMAEALPGLGFGAAAERDGRRAVRLRRSRRLLRPVRLAADIPQNRAGSLGDGHRTLSRDHHHRVLVRLHGRRATPRSARPAPDGCDVRRRLHDRYGRLSAAADREHRDADPGISAGVLRRRPSRQPGRGGQRTLSARPSRHRRR